MTATGGGGEAFLGVAALVLAIVQGRGLGTRSLRRAVRLQTAVTASALLLASAGPSTGAARASLVAAALVASALALFLPRLLGRALVDVPAAGGTSARRTRRRDLPFVASGLALATLASLPVRAGGAIATAGARDALAIALATTLVGVGAYCRADAAAGRLLRLAGACNGAVLLAAAVPAAQPTALLAAACLAPLLLVAARLGLGSAAGLAFAPDAADGAGGVP